jgi:hypothetical protein
MRAEIKKKIIIGSLEHLITILKIKMFLIHRSAVLMQLILQVSQINLQIKKLKHLVNLLRLLNLHKIVIIINKILFKVKAAKI